MAFESRSPPTSAAVVTCTPGWLIGPEIRQALAAERPFGLTQQIEALEKREIQRALDRAEGNKAQAARILGVTRKGLGDRLRRLGLDEG